MRQAGFQGETSCHSADAGLQIDPVPEMLVSIVRTTEEFKQLDSDWTDLLARSGCGNVFLSFDWMFEWWKHFGNRRTLFIVTVRDRDGRLTGLAPLSMVRGPLRQVSVNFLADEMVGSDYLDMLADPAVRDQMAPLIAGALMNHSKEWDRIYLADTGSSQLLLLLREALIREGMVERHAPASTCLYIHLPDSVEKYSSQISANLRTKLRRHRRQLEEVAPVRFIRSHESGEIEKDFSKLMDLHRLRFSGKKVESAFLKKDVIEFHAGALTKLAARGWARLYVLEVAGTPVGALYGFSLAGKFSFYQCGMHPEWRKFGIGQLVMGMCIDEAIRTGHREYDFLRGAEPYKNDWASEQRQTLNIVLFNRSLKGRQARLAYVLGQRVRSIRRAVRLAAERLGA